MKTHHELTEIMNFISEYASIQIGSGVHTSRVVRNTRRMFLRSLNDPNQGMEYMELFFLNGSVTFSVIALMTVGATLPNLIFKKLAFTMTRDSR